jgi:hypothetical protein
MHPCAVRSCCGCDWCWGFRLNRPQRFEETNCKPPLQHLLMYGWQLQFACHAYYSTTYSHVFCGAVPIQCALSCRACSMHVYCSTAPAAGTCVCRQPHTCSRRQPATTCATKHDLHGPLTPSQRFLTDSHRQLLQAAVTSGVTTNDVTASAAEPHMHSSSHSITMESNGEAAPALPVLKVPSGSDALACWH